MIEVLSVTPEVYPLIKTGGLADVTGALPAALKPLDVRLRTLLPLYPEVTAFARRSQPVCDLPDLFGGPCRILSARVKGLDLFLLDAPHLFSRPGGPYLDEGGRDHPNNAQRFAALARAGALLGGGSVAAYRADVVHAHDWQAALACVYLAVEEGARPATVLTVHNLAYQGVFPAEIFPQLGLKQNVFGLDGIEYFGKVGYLKGGLRFADRITTVSPTYAAEICTPEWGMGLDGLLRGRADRLHGILNGIDEQVWNPAADPALPGAYSAEDLAPRGLNKSALQARMGLHADPGAPVLGVVSRLTWQKGLDLLLDALPAALSAGWQVAVLGSGDADLQSMWTRVAAASAGRIGCIIGYDEDIAHLVQGGADALAVPSRFEPCGLTQLCALRYGCIPIVGRVGGLSDTVIDASPMALASGVATGLQVSPVSTPMLETALRRGAHLYGHAPTWARMQANAMAQDVSWRAPAAAYAALYRSVAKAAA